ncbi:hypothetical protein KP509_26G007200 [Ceratopteris richardii]|uniref:Deacetylase sirtuin-type domain-containing protein n=1 Tax=Ceratopteris richardii TaxID=49495 RepID=A0A8T2RK28_CERRI|nr:hypothetical protein KP509_26G007200 [Ceratopteris richardii]
MNSELDAAITRAAEIIISGNPIVAFTGAGISVESGIPDFRSPGGLWSKYEPSVYCNFQIFRKRPELFWEMATEMHATMKNARPNPAHFAMAELERLGLLSCIVTQNVDNLHQEAGSNLVYELHGNASKSTCIGCKQSFATNDLISELESNKDLKVPKCPTCHGVIKMNAVLFGEPLPRNVLENAMRAARETKVLLVVGTSLVVSPANSIVDLCKDNDGKVLICDPNPSNETLADVMLCGAAGMILPRLVNACSMLLRRGSIADL